ncbi:hypothetical protein [Modestobacter sp. URMC 112]
MLPDSARELKALLSQRLSDAPPGSVLPRGSGQAEAYDLGGATRWSGVALGLAPVGPRSVHLAVRLVAEADAAAVLGGLDEAARGEVDVRVIGRVRPLSSPGSSPEELQRRVRPLRPGLSVGHPAVSAGTLGGFVRAPGDDRLLVLSNNHVLAASDAATAGDAALQPGVADGGTPADRIGVLSSSVPLSPEPGNLVDAAVAVLDPAETADPAGYPGGALAALVAAVDDVDPDELVEKVGRTTGHTRGRVTAVEVDGVGVQYDEGIVTFDDQVEIEGLTGAFSAGGDSGSVIWRGRDRAPLGLLFAGSSTGGSAGGGVTFANPMATVLRELGVDWAKDPLPPTTR